MGNDIVDDVRTDVDGFLIEGDAWSEAVAFELASAAGIRQLSDQHWQVIRTLRDSYVSGEVDLFPRVPGICASLGLSGDCITDLFGDPAVAWRVAGLPKPGVDLSVYMPGSELT
jgi:tRNA 2-thiouridine synthesizing protein E